MIDICRSYFTLLTCNLGSYFVPVFVVVVILFTSLYIIVTQNDSSDGLRDHKSQLLHVFDLSSNMYA